MRYLEQIMIIVTSNTPSLSTGVHMIPSKIDWLILEAEINHVVVVNNWKYDVKL